MNRYIKLIFLSVFICLSSCKDKVQSNITIYSNNFESQDLTGITGGVIGQFNGSKVLGQYNNGGFTIRLEHLPKHNLVAISFDLYIHDSWDGNKPAPDGPDIWEMLVDGNTDIYTTFSNAACQSGNLCPPQSFPFNYPNNYNNPKTGAFNANLPGICLNPGPGGTTQYKITKTITHSSDILILQCLDKLVQTNSPDPKCDESWSVDNINIKAITL